MRRTHLALRCCPVPSLSQHDTVLLFTVEFTCRPALLLLRVSWLQGRLEFKHQWPHLTSARSADITYSTVSVPMPAQERCTFLLAVAKLRSKQYYMKCYGEHIDVL